MIKILSDDIGEMKQVCFTGRVSRLVNVLNGFYDDMRINISSGSQIQAKYNIVLQKYKKIVDDNKFIYNILFYYDFKEMLVEIETEKEVLNVWLEPLKDEMEEWITENNFDVNDYEKLLEEIKGKIDSHKFIKKYNSVVKELKLDELKINEIEKTKIEEIKYMNL